MCSPIVVYSSTFLRNISCLVAPFRESVERFISESHVLGTITIFVFCSISLSLMWPCSFARRGCISLFIRAQYQSWQWECRRAWTEGIPTVPDKRSGGWTCGLRSGRFVCMRLTRRRVCYVTRMSSPQGRAACEVTWERAQSKEDTEVVFLQSDDWCM